MIKIDIFSFLVDFSLGLGTKDRKVWRMVTCLLNHVSKKQLHENDKGVLVFFQPCWRGTLLFLMTCILNHSKC